MKYPEHLLKLMEVLKRLPGVGSKSAERFSFQMLEWKEEYLAEFAKIVKEIPTKLKYCEECGCLTEDSNCQLCNASCDRAGIMCVIATAKDAFAVERTREYRGIYHVLGGLLSPLEGRGPDCLKTPKLIERIHKHQIKEVVIALDSTLEGDATALYLKGELDKFSIQVSRLAFGLPMGSSLDYVDGGTLAQAFIGRSSF